MTTTLPSSRFALTPALELVGRLAMEHTAHVRFLRGRFPRCDESLLEDALQTAYAEALQQLREPLERRPQFGSYDAARGWLRTIATNTARRSLRPNGEIALTGEEDFVATTTADGDLLERSEREQVHDGMRRALGRLTDEHARLLRWRYVEELSPAAIMELEGLSTLGQYDGRHRRALDALRAALVRLPLDDGCGKARVALLRRPGVLLDSRRTAAHVVACVPCQAYQRRLRGALAAMPVSPVALRALSDAVRGQPSGTGGDAGDSPELPAQPGAVTPEPAHVVSGAAAKLGAVAAATAVALGGLAMATRGNDGDAPTAPPPAVEPARATAAPAPQRLRWADHGAARPAPVRASAR